MNELSLFTGAGGGILGSILLGWRTVGYVEIDQYCQAVIRQRQIDGIYDDAPIFADIRAFDGKPWRGCVDIVTAGFPCQPFSVAGQRRGADDERNMWPDTLRVISEVRPRYAFLENVPGLLSSGYFGTILGDLAEIGYDARWTVLGADDVGAPHRRKRLWILAYPNTGRELQPQGIIKDKRGWACDGNQGMAHSQCRGRGEGSQATRREEGIVVNGLRSGRREEDMADAENIGLQQPTRERYRKGQIARLGEMANTDNSGSRQDTEQGELRADRIKQSPVDKGRTRQAANEERPQRVRWWDTDPADVDNALCRRHEPQKGKVRAGRDGIKHTGEGPTQPRLGRVAHGVANRVDRLKAIGNGQVPAVVRAAWMLLSEGLQ